MNLATTAAQWPTPLATDGAKPSAGNRKSAGLTREEIDYLGKTGAGIPKASRRDLPVLVAQGRDGACTVTTTMMIADMAGIRVFATGGIGGVHRGAQETFDISADLEELADTSVMVICAGAKSILDLGLTLEYLETHGVTVIGYGTDELPAFYTRKSGFGVDYELDTPAELAKAFHVKREQAAAYRDRILAALPAGLAFEPLMTLYLTDNTPPAEIAKAAASGFVKAVKLYPAGATTNSDAGLTAIEKAYDTLAEMERVGLPLLVHGEVTDPKVDLFDREKVFIDTVLAPLTQRFPKLKVVMEHITTQDAAVGSCCASPLALCACCRLQPVMN